MASCIRSRFAHAKPYAACHRRRWGTKDDAPEVEKGYGGNIILNVQLQCNAANSKMEFIIRFYAEPLFVFCFLCTTAQHHHTYYISSTHRPSPLLSPLVQVTSSSPFKQGNMWKTTSRRRHTVWLDSLGLAAAVVVPMVAMVCCIALQYFYPSILCWWIAYLRIIQSEPKKTRIPWFVPASSFGTRLNLCAFHFVPISSSLKMKGDLRRQTTSLFSW